MIKINSAKAKLKRNKSSFILKGFTLIELLVVMAIIAVLVSISVFALQGARESGRNAQRKANLETIRQAFELFKSDCGRYPVSLPAAGGSLQGTLAQGCSPLNSNYYLSNNTPGDPTTGRVYYYTTTGTTYSLYAALEGEGTAIAGTDCGGGVQCTYGVTNP